MQSSRRTPTVCRHMISGSISLPEQGFFSPFPHGTGSLSVTNEYLALEGGPPGFRRSFTCSALLGIPAWPPSAFAYRGITFYATAFQKFLLASSVPLCRSRNPGRQARRFRLFRVRSPLLAESRLISTPPGTEMFHFPGYCLPYLCIQYGISSHDGGWVAPFGDPRIRARVPLPEAYRSLPRPSSPVGAKASIICP